MVLAQDSAALTSKHHLIIACDSCGTMVDLRVKPRDPQASRRVALRDVLCQRCNWAWSPAHHRVVASPLYFETFVDGIGPPVYVIWE